MKFIFGAIGALVGSGATYMYMDSKKNKVITIKASVPGIPVPPPAPASAPIVTTEISNKPVKAPASLSQDEIKQIMAQLGIALPAI